MSTKNIREKMRKVQAQLAAEREDKDRQIAELVATWHVAREEEQEAKETVTAAVAERHRIVLDLLEHDVSNDMLAVLFDVPEDIATKMVRAAKQSARRARVKNVPQTPPQENSPTPAQTSTVAA